MNGQRGLEKGDRRATALMFTHQVGQLTACASYTRAGKDPHVRRGKVQFVIHQTSEIFGTW
jgi:hypothetical protein